MACKVFAVLRVAVLVSMLVLVACAPTTDQPLANNQPDQNEGVPQPGVTPQPGALKIQFWHEFGTMQGVAMQRLADQFNAANPSIFIVPTQQGSSCPELHQKMTAAIMADSYPDLVWGCPSDLVDYYDLGVVVPLDSYISDSEDGLGAEQLSEINTDLYFTKYDGKTIFIAAAVMEQLMYYNVDMLREAGFEQPPATWDEFDRICAAVSSPPDRYCYAFIPNASTYATWVWSRGGKYSSDDERTAAFGDAAGIDTLKWLKNQAEKQWAYQPAGAFGDTTDFGNGKVAFTFSSSSGLPYYSDAVSGSDHPFEWSIAPYPAGPSGTKVVNSVKTSMAILKSTPEKQRAAWLWIKFMLGLEGGTQWALSTAYFPTVKSTLEKLYAMDESTATAANPDFAKILEKYKLASQFADLGRPDPISPAWQGARTIVENMVTAVFTDKSGADFQSTDPVAAAEEGVQRVNQSLAEYGE